jgi:peptidoglycan/LPS O-acetylase OafA/YrhL
VRGVAILSVLLFHFLTPTNPQGAVENGLTWLVAYGALGVDLFFILSGFLITGILYDSRADSSYFRNFYMRRVLRIFPLYYGVLAIVFLVIPAIPALRNSEIAGLSSHQAWAWLYGVNIYISIHNSWAVLSYLTHFWSLAIEEQFYVVWPLAVWLLAARPRRFLAFALAVAAISAGARIIAALCGVNLITITVLTPFQLDSLALGAFIAVLVRQPDGAASARRLILPATAAGIALLALQFAVRHFSSYGNALELRSGAFHLLLAALLLISLQPVKSSGWSRFLLSSPMVTLGKYSYGLYVYHHFLSHYFIAHHTQAALAAVTGSRMVALAVQALGGMAASMAVAWLSYEYFEKYFLRLKRFWPAAPHAAG